MVELYNIIKKAYDVESRASYDYFFGLSRMASYGIDIGDLRNIINKIAVDTIIHKHLVKGIMDALNELEKVGQSLTSIEERSVSREEVPEEFKIILKRFIERHLDIEKEMIEIYNELSEKADHPVVKALARELAENEKMHHKYLRELIEKIK